MAGKVKLHHVTAAAEAAAARLALAESGNLAAAHDAVANATAPQSVSSPTDESAND